MGRILLFLTIALLLTSMGFGQIQFTAKMDGSQEVPPVTTTATGTGAFVLNAAGTALSYTITVNGLTINAGHFHNGAAGVAAGVVKTLTFVNNTASGVWSSADATQPLTDSLLTELLRGRLYVNVHTTANPGGEIRGQVLQAVPAGFSAKIDGSQEVPPTTTTATGSAVVLLSPGGSASFRVTVAGLTPSAAHFHNGPAGVAAGVVKTITLVNNSASGTWTSGDATQPLTNALLRDLVRGRLYVNAHTSTNPGGEIRGQVLPAPGLAFMATIDGSQEVPPVTTAASGTGGFVLNASGTQLNYIVTFNGLTPTAAHIHNGAAGIAAGVVKSLTIVNGTASGVWSSTDATQPFTDSMLVELLRGRLYVNAHTSANPGGEIRGQVLMASGAGFAVKLDGGQEVPPVTTNASGTASVILNPNATVTFDETVTGITPSAAHFHNGAAGVAAGVVKSISLVNNTATGTWTSADATQPLTDALLRELVKGRLYLNAHTSTNPGGEIRGQVVGSTGLATSVERIEQGEIPSAYRLDQNYPNPFNPSTVISFDVAKAGRVSLRVYNMIGQLVATLFDGVREPGAYKMSFNASSLPSGVYFYSLMADGAGIQTKKMTLLK
ncbi:MAG: hypothetical protein HW389_336 [Bacteroidetes bacterium]|nr:hypothetical protein [Bacteroidota bacterium]